MLVYFQKFALKFDMEEIVINAPNVLDDEVQRDMEVKHEMEMAALHRREWQNRPHTELVSSSVRVLTNCLPPLVRDAAVNTYVALARVRAHFVDLLSLLEREFRDLNPERPAMNMMDISLYKTLPGKYRNAFARSRRYLTRRKNRIAVRIYRTREKIAYLDKAIINSEGGIPEAPQPCSLCLLAGIGSLVTPKEQPLCSNSQCVFICCLSCYYKIKHEAGAGVVPKCPGCRAVFKTRAMVIVCKKEETNPFDILSDDDESEGESEVSMPLDTDDEE